MKQIDKRILDLKKQDASYADIVKTLQKEKFKTPTGLEVTLGWVRSRFSQMKAAGKVEGFTKRPNKARSKVVEIPIAEPESRKVALILGTPEQVLEVVNGL